MIYRIFFQRKILFCVFIAVSIIGCDKSQVVVNIDSTESNQVYLLNINSTPITTNFPAFDNITYKVDSSFTLCYQNQEEMIYNEVSNQELFSANIFHKLANSTTLDYGIVSFSDINVGITSNSNSDRSWITYSYTNTNSTVKNSTNYSSIGWKDEFRLINPLRLTCKGSTKIDDISLLIPTKVPDSITNIQTGQSISVGTDLEIDFRYTLQKGSIISFGFGSHYFHFEVLNSSSKFIISKGDLHNLKEILSSESSTKCYIGFVEGFYLGDLKTTDKNTKAIYLLPIFQFTRSTKTIYLKD
jgi:hypothetical protein